VFVGVALSREPWQLALSLLLIGFQLGNTGVMLAGIRDVVPERRLGTTMAIFGAAGPIGFAVGPFLGGFVLVDGLGWSLSQVFLLSALLSVGTAALVAIGSREVRPSVVPEGRVLALAFGAVRGVVSDPAILRIFAIYFVTYLANQLTRPYQPLIVEGLVPAGPGLASSIGIVIGLAALVGAVAATIGGALGDRLGFRPVLVGALVGGGFALLFTPLAPDDRAPGADRARVHRLQWIGRGDGLQPALDRGPAGAPVGDAEPRLPAALRGRDHRADRRRDRCAGHGAGRAVRPGRVGVPRRRAGRRARVRRVRQPAAT
jgi:MFS family permease